MGPANGPSYEPCWGHIIPFLLKRICPQIKRVVERLRATKIKIPPGSNTYLQWSSNKMALKS